MKKADKILINGRIYTMDCDRNLAEAVCIKGNKIVYVGRNEEALRYKTEDTEVMDLQNKMMIPGLIEAHAHPMLAALFRSGIILHIEMTKEEVLDKVREYVDEHPDKDVFFGQGFSSWMFGQEGPHKKILDEIVSDRPVLLLDAGGHTGWCNTRALEMAGITKNTPDPVPGSQFYRRDESGNPTGSLVEWGAVSEVSNAIGAFNVKNIEKAMETMSAEYCAAGVTAIQDGGIFKEFQELLWEIAYNAGKEGKVKQRIMASEGVFCAEDLDGAVKRLENARKVYTGDKFAVTHLKVLEDGTFEARSAATKKPFEDGVMIPPLFTEEELVKLVEDNASIGADVCIHGIGDLAIYNILSAARNLREKGYENTRIACIHCNYIDPEDLDMFAEYDVIANTTAIWHHRNKGKEEAIGERAQMNFLMNSLYKKGVKLTFGSDFPADEYGKEPLKGIEMGVTRQMYDKPEDPVLPPLSERLTVAKMLEGFTINAAYQMRMEDKIGSIEAGKYADLTVLEENLFEIDPHDIHDVPVEMTVIDGEIVYIKGKE